MARLRVKNTLSLLVSIALLPLLYHYAVLVITDVGLQWPKRAEISYSDVSPDHETASGDVETASGDVAQKQQTEKVRSLSYERSKFKPAITTRMVTQIESRTYEGKAPELPGVQNYLPHLRGKPGAMRPLLNLSKGRKNAKLVIGIPTIYRPRGSYLGQTLDSLIKNMNSDEKQKCLIIVFIAEPWDQERVNETVREIKTKYSAELRSGLLDVISPSPDYYPDLDSLKRTLNDKLFRVKWRSKQNLDYAYLMFQAHLRGEYYLQLEDDVITKEGFYEYIMSSAVSLKDIDWFILKFSMLGFIGRMFRTSDLPVVLEFLLMFHGTKPCDWLIDNLLQTLFCGRDHSQIACERICNRKARSVRPSQFQHIGYHSSLEGKVQKLKDTAFRSSLNAKKGKHRNPIAHSLYTNMVEWKSFTLRMAYVNSGYVMWAMNPKKGSVVVIEYNPPKPLSRFLFRTGARSHPNDTFPESTVVEVLTQKYVPRNFTVLDVNSTAAFVTVAKFDKQGVAEGNFYLGYGDIRVMRIRVTEPVDHWVVLAKTEIQSYHSPKPYPGQVLRRDTSSARQEHAASQKIIQNTIHDQSHLRSHQNQTLLRSLTASEANKTLGITARPRRRILHLKH